MVRAASRWVHGAALALLLYVGSATATDGLLWFDGDRPSAPAREAVELLAAAASHGLEPQDHATAALRQAVTQASVAARGLALAQPAHGRPGDRRAPALRASRRAARRGTVAARRRRGLLSARPVRAPGHGPASAPG